MTAVASVFCNIHISIIRFFKSFYRRSAKTWRCWASYLFITVDYSKHTERRHEIATDVINELMTSRCRNAWDNDRFPRFHSSCMTLEGSSCFNVKCLWLNSFCNKIRRHVNGYFCKFLHEWCVKDAVHRVCVNLPQLLAVRPMNSPVLGL